MDLAGWRGCGEELFTLVTGNPEQGQGEIYWRQEVGFPYERVLQKVRFWPPLTAPIFRNLIRVFPRLVPTGAFDQPVGQQRLNYKVCAGLCHFQRGHYFLYPSGRFFQQGQQSFLVLGERKDLASGYSAYRVYALPGAFQSFKHRLRRIFHPARDIASMRFNMVQGAVIRLTVFKDNFIYGEDMASVELLAVEFPGGQSAAHSAVAVAERVYVLELKVEYCRTYQRRPLIRAVPFRLYASVFHRGAPKGRYGRPRNEKR